VNPFCIQKNLDSIAGKVKNASCLRNGTLLVEVFIKRSQTLEDHYCGIIPHVSQEMHLSAVAMEWSGQTPLMTCLMTTSNSVPQTNFYLRHMKS
jgi:hypothetical protein